MSEAEGLRLIPSRIAAAAFPRPKAAPTTANPIPNPRPIASYAPASAAAKTGDETNKAPKTIKLLIILLLNLLVLK